MTRLGLRAATAGLAGIAAVLMSACSPQEISDAAGADFTRLEGKPDLNGLWQANGTANWNLEAHSAAAIPGFDGLGAIAAIPAGVSYVEGGTIPYLPEALAQRDANRAGWPATDPEAATSIEGQLNARLGDAIVAKRKGTAVVFTLSRTDDVLRTGSIGWQVRVLPLAYIKKMRGTVALVASASAPANVRG